MGVLVITRVFKDEDDGKYKSLAASGSSAGGIISHDVVLNNRWFSKTTGLYVDCKFHTHLVFNKKNHPNFYDEIT